MIPKVAIVGRPNVGKSSLFNWLVGRRVSIVDPTAGVTRDRVSRIVEMPAGPLELVDTGGMGITDKDGLTADVERQIRHAMDEASLILFVVDGHSGIVALDELVVRKLRTTRKTVLCVANKCDTPKLEQQAQGEFHRLGYPIVFVSAINNRNKELLLAAIAERLPANTAGVDAAALQPVMKLAVVGKRNAGKSTFINCLAEDERVIVSQTPGTTRDSIDVRFEHNGKAFVAIDTAGVRRKKSLADSIEFYSYTRAQETIRRADVVLLFIDPKTEIGKIDQQLAGYIVERNKPCVFVVNKWDTMTEFTTGQFDSLLDQNFPTMLYAPRAFITAKTGKNVQALVDLAQSLFNQAQLRVPTAEVNRVLERALIRHAPPLKRNRRAKFFYASQVATAPPTIVIFCNDPRLIDGPYRRYLLNAFREELPYAEIPIRMELRRRDSHGGPRGSAEEDQSPTASATGSLPGDSPSLKLPTESARELADLDFDPALENEPGGHDPEPLDEQ